MVVDNTYKEVTSDDMTIKRMKLKHLSINTNININIMIPHIYDFVSDSYSNNSKSS